MRLSSDDRTRCASSIKIVVYVSDPVAREFHAEDDARDGA